MTKTIITSTNNSYRFIVPDEFKVHKVVSRMIQAIVSGRRANASNVGFKNSVRWLIYIIMSVDKRKLSTSFRRRSTVGNLLPLFY